MEEHLKNILYNSREELNLFYSTIKNEVVWGTHNASVGGQHINNGHHSKIKLTYKDINIENDSFRSIYFNRDLCLLELLIQLNK